MHCIMYSTRILILQQTTSSIHKSYNSMQNDEQTEPAGQLQSYVSANVQA